MNQLELLAQKKSISRVIASSGVFQIEIMEHVSKHDFAILIEISKHLVEEYGQKALLNNGIIHKYFNKKESLPFIARYRGEIMGYNVGVPLEEFSSEPWAMMDSNFGKFNTLYTYAYVIDAKYKGNGFAKMLKKVYLNWVKKHPTIKYIAGHVKVGSKALNSDNIQIIDRTENWQNSGKTFEYYRRRL